MNGKQTFRNALAVMAVTLCAFAHATQPGNNGGGNGGCGVGQQTNGCGSTANGGQGGAGGAGGVGYGGDAKAYGGAGGSVLGSGNSSVKNDNANFNNNSVKSENNNLNAQGQKQGQDQSQSQSNKQSQSASSNQRQSNTSSNSIAGGNNSAVGSGNATQVSVGGDTVTYQAQERNPVATAYAAPLTTSNGTCMGSSSIGGQGASVGLSFGTTWTDSGCDARYDATALVQAGQPKAAIARLCLKAEIAQAMKDAGTPCPGQAGNAQAEVDLDTKVVSSEPRDPYVRARLNLPPLKK